MNNGNSIEAIDKANLFEQAKFWLDEISKIENYFIEEINQRKSCSKKLSKYVAAFDYLIILLGYLNNSKFQVEFYGSCLKPDKVTFAPNKIINFYITYKIRL